MPSPAYTDEVTFISGVNPNGSLPLNSFSAWKPSSNPADYSGGYTNTAKWGASTAGTAGGTVYYYYDPASNWTPTEQTWLANGLALWSAVANISFAQATSAAQAQITFSRGTDGTTSTTRTVSYVAGAGLTGGSILEGLSAATISISTGTSGFGPIDGNFANFGGYPTMTFLHEEGHALGLGHAGPYNTTVTESTQQFSAYDSRLWSIMSYIDPDFTSAKYYSSYPVTGTNWGSSGVPTTWMPLDILAIQALYGMPSSTPLSGGQVFGFNSNITGAIKPFFDFTINKTPIVTIWDEGTGNTLDLSGFVADETISLVPGTFSSIDGLTNNIAIAFGTAIDTLKCGSGNNVVTCNNNGDTVYLGPGNNTVTGGNGNDVFAFGNNSYAGKTDTLLGGGGFNIIDLSAAFVPNVDLTSSAALTIGGSTVTLDHVQGVIGPSSGGTLTIAGGAYADGSNACTVNLNDQAATADLVFTFQRNSSTLTTLADGTKFKNVSQLNLKTGSGNDTVTFVGGSSGSLFASWDGGSGTNTAIVNFSSVTSYFAYSVNFTNVQNCVIYAGSASGDILQGGVENDTMYAGANGSELDGGLGSNTLVGGAGDDVFSEMGAGSSIDGGGGNDSLRLWQSTLTAPVSFTFTPGSSTPATLPNGTTFKNIEYLTVETGSADDAITIRDPIAQLNLADIWKGGGGNDTLTVDLSDVAVSVSAGLGSYQSQPGFLVQESISGSWMPVVFATQVENFDILGGSGYDVLSGGTGDDILSGGGGNDTLDGGTGNDTAKFSGNRWAYTVTANANGSYTVTGTDGTDTLTNIEMLQFADQSVTPADAAASPPPSGGQTISGTSGADTLTGGADNDTINGGAGNDIINGGAGADTLNGGADEDTITGGAGNDTLDGGSSVDTAVFSGNRAAYTITQTSTGNFTITGPDGTDTLTNIEYAKFDDQTMRLLPGSGTTVSFATDPSTYMGSIRDFDGNNLGGAASWKLIGSADVNGDGRAEHILFNREIGRWAEVGTEADGLTYFANNGWAGDTRVVGIYIDPLVANGTVVKDSATDSQRRFQNDLQIDNIHGILGQGDYNHDGLQEVYFSLTDGTAYLHAYMHADGNIQYANYQNKQQVIDYLTSNGVSSSTWSTWFPASQSVMAAVAG